VDKTVPRLGLVMVISLPQFLGPDTCSMLLLELLFLKFISIS